jgi:GTPase SAR1 family protein
MESEINTWIDILKEAWYDLISDYRVFGSFERSAYGHKQEADLRCFLFCKVMDVLRSRDLFLINLHAEELILGKKVDIVLGLEENGPEEDRWKLGVEIKRTGDVQLIKKDLEKLRFFIVNRKIQAGVFLTMAKHSVDLKDLFQHHINAEYKLEEKDTGNNNFTEWHPIKIPSYNVDWDALFLVLRKV